MISWERAPQVGTEIALCCQLEKWGLKMEEIRDISGLGKEKKKHVRKLCLQDRKPLGVWGGY